MSEQNDAIRRQLGCDLIREHQRTAGTRHQVEAIKPAPEQDNRKTADEQCTTILDNEDGATD
jgi:hypothetical protein